MDLKTSHVSDLRFPKLLPFVFLSPVLIRSYYFSFNKHLIGKVLYVKPCARCWRYKDEQSKLSLSRLIDLIISR